MIECQRARSVYRLTALLVASGLGVGCSLQPPQTPLQQTVAVGPAPLRRLSNREYLNALADLFPDQHPTLPELPNDTPVAGFENAAETQQPSDLRIARYQTIADLYAQAATVDTDAVRALVGCSDWSLPTQAATCAAQMMTLIGARIFRRPLDREEQDRFTARFAAWAAAIDF